MKFLCNPDFMLPGAVLAWTFEKYRILLGGAANTSLKPIPANWKYPALSFLPGSVTGLP